MVRPRGERRVILVSGATGRQGGAVVRHLLQRGFDVRGLTRDINKPAARRLTDGGVDVVEGNLDDRASVDRALQGVYGVFSVQNFWETGYEREIAQGKLLADASKDAHVQHFVYSSVGSAHRQTGLSHFDSKWQVEKHIRHLGLPYSILRPVFFMENWATYAGAAIRSGVLAQPLDPDRPLQQIAVDDIGAFTGMAVADPGAWMGRELDLAGDSLTMPQVCQVFSRHLGREVRYQQVSWDQFGKVAGEESTKMYRWFNDVGYEANIPALRREYPQLRTLEQFLRESPEWKEAAQPAAR